MLPFSPSPIAVLLMPRARYFKICNWCGRSGQDAGLDVPFVGGCCSLRVGKGEERRAGVGVGAAAGTLGGGNQTDALEMRYSPLATRRTLSTRSARGRERLSLAAAHTPRHA